MSPFLVVGSNPHEESGVGCEGQKRGRGAPPTPTPCSWQEPESPLNPSAMGEMEQLRQEAEQLKKQIAVTTEPSHWGTPENMELGA